MDHIVNGTTFFATIAETGTPPAEDGDPAFTPDGVVAAFDSGSARAVRAFAADGAMERIMHPPFGDIPGSVFVGITAGDAFTHGWDLAKATGQPTDLDPEVAAQLLEFEASVPLRRPARPRGSGPVRAEAGGSGRCFGGRPAGHVHGSAALVAPLGTMPPFQRPDLDPPGGRPSKALIPHRPSRERRPIAFISQRQIVDRYRKPPSQCRLVPAQNWFYESAAADGLSRDGPTARGASIRPSGPE